MAKDWGEIYIDLSRRIERHLDEPKEDGKWAGPYLESMEMKRQERDEAKMYYNEVSNPANLKPEEREMGYANMFQSLIEKAQGSGDWTVDFAAIRVLQWGSGTWAPTWDTCIRELKSQGRPLKLKAEGCGFDTRLLIDRAKNMCRYAVANLESDPHLFGMYEGRERVIGTPDKDGNIVLPEDRDWDSSCEPRSNYTLQSKGKPLPPADVKLKDAATLRDECDWWGFSGESNDVANLMVEYYKDVICRLPEEGHKWYHKIAESQINGKYYLDEAIKYNEDFYATLKGKVEIDTGFSRTPAKGATVRLYAPKDKQEWITITDDDGKYEIKDALLHKYCSPFDISAKLDELETKDTIDGPLEEPNKSYEHEKNLVLKARFSLEIIISFILRSDSPAFFGEWRFSGIVPFNIQQQGEIFIINGEGTIQFSFNGLDHNCPIVMTPLPAGIKVKLDGKIMTLKRPVGGRVLQITMKESWEGSKPTWTIVCPDKPPQIVPSVLGYWDVIPGANVDTVEFYEIKDGFVLNRDFTLGGWTEPKKRFILHFTK